MLLSATQLVEQQENAAEYDAFSFIDENTLVCATRAAEPIATDPITRYYEDILDVDGDTLIAVTQAAEQHANARKSGTKAIS